MKWCVIAGKGIAVVVLLMAAYYAVRMGVADAAARRETVEGLELAMRLEPGNADYHRWMGITVLARDPGRSEREFREAFRLNRWDTDSRVRVAALLEAQGKFDEAERGLLEATQFDRMFLPRWSLANFYFRRQRMPEFWKWMRASVEMSFGDRTPIFDLAWASGETDLAGRLGLQKDEVALGYLWWGLGKVPAAEVKTAALHVAGGKHPDGRAVAFACDRLTDLGDVGGALEVWNAGVAAGIEAAGKAARGAVTNGEFRAGFRAEAGGAGFDWVGEKPQGGAVLRETEQSGFRARFNGDQVENGTVLWQRVAVKRGAAYRVRVKYRTMGLGKNSGLRWAVWSAKGLVAKAEKYLWSDEADGMAEFEFEAPGDGEWVRLALGYERPPGEVRAEGAVTIHGVELEAVRSSIPVR